MWTKSIDLCDVSEGSSESTFTFFDPAGIDFCVNSLFTFCKCVCILSSRLNYLSLFLPKKKITINAALKMVVIIKLTLHRIKRKVIIKCDKYRIFIFKYARSNAFKISLNNIIEISLEFFLKAGLLFFSFQAYSSLIFRS